jgi:purine-nucleoside phosphorylase
VGKPLAEINDALDLIRSRFPQTPRVGIVLGSGLGSFVDAIDVQAVFEAHEIPGYPVTTTMGHKGRVLCGQLSGVPMVAIDGRPHSYEGHSFARVGFPTQLLIALGIDTLLLSNAAGAVNLEYNAGDLMILDDHINMMWDNPLMGPNRDEVGPRFPDMSAPYDAELIELAKGFAEDSPINIHQGVYLAMPGPSYETHSEYRMARILGADVVGMSTVPEVLVARHAGVRCAAFSIVSNVFDPSARLATSGQDVLEIVAQSEPVLRRIVTGIVEQEAKAGSSS